MAINIAIFASGAGTNAQNIIDYYKSKLNESNISVNVNLVISNNPKAYVLERAKKENIEFYVISKEDLKSEDLIIEILDQYCIDLIILAGFILKIPNKIVSLYQNKIINIHPSLLPKFGGKGMYGSSVHNAVINSKENESGITIHLVDDKYDNGKVIFQAKCPVSIDDTPESLANKIHALEAQYFPDVINNYIMDNLESF